MVSAEKKTKFKSFKRRQPVPEDDELFASPMVGEPTEIPSNVVSFKEKFSVQSFMADLTQIIDQQNEIVIGSPSDQDNITAMPVMKVIDWSEDKGRFALAENVLKQNEVQFAAAKQRMQQMADADGCGGVNESKSITTGSLGGVSRGISFGGTSFGRSSGHSHAEGEGDHCDNCGSDKEDGICKQCSKAA